MQRGELLRKTIMKECEKYYLGIDLGTSSVKLLLVSAGGTRISAKSKYTCADPHGWCTALQNALASLFRQIPAEQIAAIALSAQVGTYLTDNGHVIGWNSNAGKDELAAIKAQVDRSVFTKEIDMEHPELISYPLPRLLYIKRHFPDCKSVIMPKEFLLQELTGNTVTDIFSQRGLCHPHKKCYSEKLLTQFDLHFCLPPIKLPTDLGGYITKKAAQKYGLAEHTPVYLGCNDFFAGLLGMGVYEKGTVFELSGTSEHLGVITDTRKDGKLVSGAYFNGCVTYGGTKASGTSCDMAIQMFGLNAVNVENVYRNPPIFLPYLKGERAPIFDENAKGVFFGITDHTTKADFAYAVLEGVVFSLYHIGKSLALENIHSIIIGGGSAVDMCMTQLKAALFNCNVITVVENDCSALGAAMIAMVGSGCFATLPDAIRALVAYTDAVQPNRTLRDILLKRFSIYESLYPTLTAQFEQFSSL